jgi:PTS system nitrogen regulatory IIA component
MQLTDILQPEGLKLISQISSKKRLFHDLGELAEECHGYRSAAVIEALLDREALGPTGVGHGVALPHARLEGVKHVTGIFMRIEKPIEFESVDRQPVDLVFGLFAPVDAGVEHLKALALVSRTMRNPEICAKLRANNNTSALYSILTESQASSQAA